MGGNETERIRDRDGGTYEKKNAINFKRRCSNLWYTRKRDGSLLDSSPV